MEPKLAAELVRQGVLLQVNAGSILGRHGLGVMLLCRRLLKENLVFCVASDAHDLRSRAPILSKCYRKIKARYGEERANQLFRENPDWLLQENND